VPGDGQIMDGRPFDRAMAKRHGLGRDSVTRLIREGRLRAVVRGVYVDATVPDDLPSRAEALHLRLPPDAVVCRRTAAWLLGVDGAGPGEDRATLPVECAVPTGRTPVRRPGVIGVAAPPDREIVTVDGIPCTTPTRTAVDVLRWCPPHVGLAAVDIMAARRLVEVEQVQAKVEEFAGDPGVRRARYLASLIEPLTQSKGETWLRLRMVDAGFPRPRAQIPVVSPWGDLALLDLGWDEERVAVEYDGEEFHSTPAQRAHDRWRRDWIERERHWRLLAVGKGEVLGPSLALERAVGELLSREPTIIRRRW
jgi:hypothetical protein